MPELSLRERWDAALHAEMYIDYGPQQYRAGERSGAVKYYAPERGTLLRTAARFVVGLGFESATAHAPREAAKNGSITTAHDHVTRLLDRAHRSTWNSALLGAHGWASPRHYAEKMVGSTHRATYDGWSVHFNSRDRRLVAANDESGVAYEVSQLAEDSRATADNGEDRRWLTSVRVIMRDGTALDAAHLPPLMAVHHYEQLAAAVASTHDALSYVGATPVAEPFMPSDF